MKRNRTRAQATTFSDVARKTVSLIASAALVVSMLGVPAFADPAEDEEPTTGEAIQETAPSESNMTESPSTELGGGEGTGGASTPDDAAEADGDGPGEGGSKIEVPADPSENEPVVIDQAKSIIHIDVTDARSFGDDAPIFYLALSNRGDQRIVTSKSGGGFHGSYTFVNVESGDYTLTVTADRFARYSQEIFVESEVARSYTVKINTCEMVSYTEDGSSHSGVMYYGDVNEDNVIDKADVSALVSAIDDGATAADRPECDLSSQGDDISLLDLQILSEGLGREPVDSAVPSKPRITGVTVSDNVTIPSDSQIVDVSAVVGNPDESASLKLASENPISPENPIVIEMDNLQDQLKGEQTEVITIKPPVSTSDEGGVVVSPNRVTGGTAVVAFERDGQPDEDVFTIESAEAASGIEQAARSLGLLPQRAYAANKMATIDASGNIVIHLGGKVAIKKVTLTVTKTAASDGDLNLAEISSVEFLNGAEDLIAPPDMNIPENVKADPGSKQFTVSWDRENNVTGYEVCVEQGGNSQIYPTKGTSMVVSSFKTGKKGKIENGVEYAVKVQSTNGAWRSGWSEPVHVTPKATKAPAAPENVRATGGYRMITLSWKAMEDTDSYNIYYRKGSDGPIQTITGIQNSSYQIGNLEDQTEYQIYLKGKNEIGEGPASRTVSAATTTIAPAELPTYKTLNTKDANGHYLTGITNARSTRGSMVDSSLDAGKSTALGLFDGDYTSYMKLEDWDLGCAYNAGSHGVEVTFDGVKNIGFISYAASSQNIDYSGVVVHASTGDSKWQRVQGVSFAQQKCANGRTYTLIKIAGGLQADKVLIGMQRYLRLIDIAEMRFHAYDSIEDDVDALYADDLHIKLADGVDEERINQLEARLNTPEPDGSYYPYRSNVQAELNFARQLLADENAGLSQVIKVHSDISTAADNGKNLGIGGLNAWQPLGKVAAEGDQLVIYASCRNAANTSVQLYVGQQYPESAFAPSYGGTFQAGKRLNYTVPKKISDAGKEHGGPLYAQFEGSNTNAEWYIRIMGGHDIPVLDLHNVDDHEARVRAAEAYIAELDEAVSLVQASKADEAAHKEAHKKESKKVVNGSATDQINPSVDHDFSYADCIHNATELMTDTMLYSVPATAAVGACKGSSPRERAENLVSHMDGSEQMMKLFYQHKGLMEPAQDVAKTNQISSRHLNIRLMQMFDGAFMYAAGNHIGVDYGQSGNFAILSPISAAATAPGGTRTSTSDGHYFGWGTAHEIGHNINNGRYALAEVTNNYFAQLCRMIENGTTRFTYDKVYERVTSGAEGRTGNVFTQLAMYWQLMLAHDTGEVYTLYSTYDQLRANRFFARVDGYARNPGSAPQPAGVPLVVNAGESQNIIRLASAAAEKDLTDFFVSWGLTPNAETKNYVSQFPKETRALQYVNDDSARFARTNPDAAKVTGADVVSVAPLAEDNSKVTLNLSLSDAQYATSLLGYEVSRVTYASGKPVKKVITFAVAGDGGAATYVDDAAYLGNRAVSYEVKAVDKFLNYSAPKATEQVKLTGDGRYTPDEWTVTTNMVSDADQADAGAPPASGDADGFPGVVDQEPDCPAEVEKASPKAIESVLDSGSRYVGKTKTDANAPAAAPYVMVDMHETLPVASVRYRPGEGAGAALGKYTIEVSTNGIAFTKVAEGTFEVNGDGFADVFFKGPEGDGGDGVWIRSENARYVRITAPDQAGKDVKIEEFSIFGPRGDNIDFTKVQGQEGIAAIGTLTEDFAFEEGDPTKVIPAGSILFTGAVKGNMAYNVVVLYDESGTIVGGTLSTEEGEMLKAEQILLTDLPDDAPIGDTDDGRWIYWIAPGSELPDKVRAELYRVNNAFTNEGQRLVADSLFENVPETLPGITLTRNGQ